MIHKYSSTGSAYDACQCDESVKTGDILLIESERVVGLAMTWPVAVTEEYGHLHTVADGYSLDGMAEFTTEQVAAARALVKEMGYE